MEIETNNSSPGTNDIVNKYIGLLKKALAINIALSLKITLISLLLKNIQVNGERVHIVINDIQSVDDTTIEVNYTVTPALTEHYPTSSPSKSYHY